MPRSMYGRRRDDERCNARNRHAKIWIFDGWILIVVVSLSSSSHQHTRPTTLLLLQQQTRSCHLRALLFIPHLPLIILISVVFTVLRTNAVLAFCHFGTSTSWTILHFYYNFYSCESLYRCCYAVLLSPLPFYHHHYRYYSQHGVHQACLGTDCRRIGRN
jgi:hypothetical protein